MAAIEQNVTERNQAENTQAQVLAVKQAPKVQDAVSPEQFRATFEHAAVGIAHVSPEGKWTWVNERLCEITGYSREELLTRRFQDITYPDDLEADLVAAADLLAGKIDTYASEKRYIRKDGSPFWIELAVSLLKSSSGEPAYFITVVQDIDARKKSQHMRDKALSLGFHDVRSPLGAISMSASFLLDVPLPEEQRNSHLRIIQRAANRMACLIQNLSDAAHIKSGQPLSVKLDAWEVGELIGEACSVIRPAAVEKGIELICRASASLPPVLADQERMIQVLSNLLDNAIQVTPDGGRITLQAEQMNDEVRISVADGGPGIPREHLPTLFEPYWQVGPEVHPGFDPMIARAIMEAHGGRIWAESIPGVGTEFFLALPAQY